MTRANSISVRSGYTFRGNTQFDTNGAHHLIQFKNLIKDGVSKKLDVSNLDKIISPTDNSKLYIKNGDILIVKTGDDRSAYMVENVPERTLVGQHFLIVSSTDPDKLPPEFITFFINLPSSQLFLSTQTGGGKQPSIKKTALEKLKIPLLSKEEQTELMVLANEIGKEKEILEQLISNRERQLQKLIELKAEENTDV